MTTHLSEDTAMRALEAARPIPESVDEVWSPTRADRVLHAVLDQTTGSPRPSRQVSRRWALVAAVAGIATIGLIGQAVIPSGSVGSATPAQALDNLASHAVAITIPDGKFLKVVTTHTIEPTGTMIGGSSQDTTWYADDGWCWSTTSLSDAPEVTYRRDTWPTAEFAALLPQPMPDDPASLVDAINQRAADYVATHPPKANFVPPPSLWVALVADGAFKDVRTSAADRALLIRSLALLPNVTVDEHAVDPRGRPAVEVAVKYSDPHFPDAPQREYRLFLDGDGLVLASQIRMSGGKYYQSWITERSLVDSVPADVIKTVGSGHKTKMVTR
ncbi:MAG: hypothetical protein CVT62_10010 [Actinobacteria bacterium HGW-Actinobacteria-2]|nr:MAG: hypothetical protein CVT62_10010 [Actinobacteria bacterium HGW-Actinobacteria-2]